MKFGTKRDYKVLAAFIIVFAIVGAIPMPLEMRAIIIVSGTVVATIYDLHKRDMARQRREEEKKIKELK